MFDPPCLWCGGRPANSLEHILPEALGCPPEFVLKEGVCRNCNNKKLANLDRALLKPFELLTVVRGIRRKKGKAPTIDNFSTVSSTHGQDGPQLFINRGKVPIQPHFGKKLGPTSKKDEFTGFAVKHLGSGKAEITIEQKMFFDRAAVRGLFKIALETMAYFHGLEVVMDAAFDQIRDFVIQDKGEFGAVMLPGGPFDGHFGNPYSKDGRPFVVPMTILGIGFVCDFDPGFASGNEVMQACSAMKFGANRLPHQGM